MDGMLMEVRFDRKKAEKVRKSPVSNALLGLPFKLLFKSSFFRANALGCRIDQKR